MGDIKRLKKKYSRPMHPWSKTAIEQEAKLVKEYGLVKKKEIYISTTLLKKYKDIAKKLIADNTVQGKKEKQQMLEKLQRIGLISEGADVDQVLKLQIKDVLERRIQSIIFRRGYARSMGQARQFIVHRHVLVGNKEITSPSYIVGVAEQNAIVFKPKSNLSSADHPERVIIQKATKEEKKEVAKEEVKPKEEKIKEALLQ